jgi:hypothetical protein
MCGVCVSCKNHSYAQDYKSSARNPVCFAIRANIRGNFHSIVKRPNVIASFWVCQNDVRASL